MNLLRTNVKSATINVTAPVAQSAIPRRKKGVPLTQPVPPPDFALRVHAEFNVSALLITQRPTATVTRQRIHVADLFTILFYHRETP
jgi:hypothetical protein